MSKLIEQINRNLQINRNMQVIGNIAATTKNEAHQRESIELFCQLGKAKKDLVELEREVEVLLKRKEELVKII